MKSEIRVPAVGESITEARILEWKVQAGQFVNKNEVLLLLETDKATVEVVAENAGVLEIKEPQDAVVKIGSVVGVLDSEAQATVAAQPISQTQTSGTQKAPTANQPPPPPAAGAAKSGATSKAPPTLGGKTPIPGVVEQSPAVRRLAAEHSVDVSAIEGTGRGGRVTKGDVFQHLQAPVAKEFRPAGAQSTRREPMSMIRRRIAERLVQAQHTAAILTTFNEIDMTSVMELRKQYKEVFKQKYGINLGFMGIFMKAAIEALKENPRVNASIDGTDIVYHDYHNIGIAVGAERGLVVPVVRDADQLSIVEIEKAIAEYAAKAKDGKISIEDLSDGTFTISNGGVFGSLLSTPILNPPQSGILGLHKIEERPIALNGQVVIRPMMYVALSYDHRIIDGREAVTFLVRIKQCVEDPQRLLLGV